MIKPYFFKKKIINIKNLIKNKFFLINEFIIIYNTKIYLFNNIILKNEMFTLANIHKFNKYITCIGYNKLIDIIGYDTTKLKFINKFKKPFLSFYKIFFNKNLILNIMNMDKKEDLYFKNFFLLLRELSEFFGKKLSNTTDTRNLLNNYSDKNHYLLKKISIFNNDIKFINNRLKFFKKTFVVL